MLPEVSKKSYVSVVQSLVAFSKGQDDDDDDDQVQKIKGKKRGPWFPGPPLVPNGQQQQFREGQQRDRVARYKDKFEPRVTAR